MENVRIFLEIINDKKIIEVSLSNNLSFDENLKLLKDRNVLNYDKFLISDINNNFYDIEETLEEFKIIEGELLKLYIV